LRPWVAGADLRCATSLDNGRRVRFTQKSNFDHGALAFCCDEWPCRARSAEKNPPVNPAGVIEAGSRSMAGQV
jgi:hypothetical protein